MLSSTISRSSLLLTRRTAVVMSPVRSGGAVRAMGAMPAMPVPQSQKAKLFDGHHENEGWEFTMTWWYGTSLILIIGAVGFTPNTEITAWANKEAAARLKLKAAGVEEFAFGTHYQDLTVAQAKEAWDTFGAKALRMNDDDDDEEEEDEDDDDDDDE
eukprot:scaffold1001_cov169-Amphora_coffeaeformis.AAC.11